MWRSLDALAAHGRRLIAVNRDYFLGILERRRQMATREGTFPDPAEVMAEARCCFVLSTGRCGTKLLTTVLERLPSVIVEHQPVPELQYASATIHNECVTDPVALRLAAIAARFNHVTTAYLRGRQYIETNNRITFLARPLAELFHRSVFIHLIRHPGEYVRSGMRRGYYTDARMEHEQLHPLLGTEANVRWLSMDRLERIAWQWNETQQYIEEFKATLPAARVMTVRAEKLFTEPSTTLQICRFLGLKPGAGFARTLERRLRSPVNAQRSGTFPTFDEWPITERDKVARWAPLGIEYGYL